MSLGNREQSDRRAFLKGAAGVVGTGIVAGCVGQGDASEDEQEDQSGQEQENQEEQQNQDEGEFPTQDIQLVIPYGSGGYDSYTRLVAPYLEEHLPGDVNVQPQNVAGAGGQIATEEVYNAEPDGHKNMIVNVQGFGRKQVIEDVDYDLREMTWYAQIASNTVALAVGTNTDIQTFDEYVDGVQNEEIRITATSPDGNESATPYLLGELGELYDGRNVIENRVMYDGRSESLQGILGGDAEVMAGSYSSLLPYIESDDLRVLMFITQDEESFDPDRAPDAETLATKDVANADQIMEMLSPRRAFAGPPDVPQERAEILADAFEEAINDEDFQSEAEESEMPIDHADGESTTEYIESSIQQWEDNKELLEALSG